MQAAEKIYELLKALPEKDVEKVLTFVESLQKVQEQPLDFRNAAGLGKEVWQAVDVEAYLQQKRSQWD